MSRKDDSTVYVAEEQGQTAHHPASPQDTPYIPSMDDAFATLCHAMIAQVALEENLALEERIHTIMGFYENKLHTVAWRHAVQILEQVIGEPLVER